MNRAQRRLQQPPAPNPPTPLQIVPRITDEQLLGRLTRRVAELEDAANQLGEMLQAKDRELAALKAQLERTNKGKTG